MKESIYSGYYGACSETTNPRDPFKYVINSKSLIGSSTDELVKEYKAKAKEVYPDLTNQFADFIAFDNNPTRNKMNTTYKITRLDEEYFVTELNELKALTRFYEQYPQFSGHDVQITEWAINLY